MTMYISGFNQNDPEQQARGFKWRAFLSRAGVRTGSRARNGPAERGRRRAHAALWRACAGACAGVRGRGEHARVHARVCGGVESMRGCMHGCAGTMRGCAGVWRACAGVRGRGEHAQADAKADTGPCSCVAALCHAALECMDSPRRHADRETNCTYLSLCLSLSFSQPASVSFSFSLCLSLSK
ncbi:hypothetical protein ANANG_G00267760 [Anguilla anguilla]|uniref:Uncharacterized protein n=1 Tax=Anguilla anguilla TaxID=7936 RepID=A0A9D3LSW8_ANGAN|nr:hypothetical protein ANANG_G00267760 [Anguilla anguilla]